MGFLRRFGRLLAMALSLATASAGLAAAAPLNIGYSDWPGYVAWQVAIDKGWLKQAGVDANFQWFDYSASLDAFSAGKLDGVFTTNGDTLVMGSGGGKGVMIMLTDYSSGNDMIIGQPTIQSLKELKGKKVGVEVGLVDHLLLMHGLEQVGLGEKDITLVNTKTNETPQILASGQVAAIGAWQPSAGEAMKLVPGAHPIYTSAQAPGLIFDVLTVNPVSLTARHDDWVKLVKVWDRVVHYIDNPATQPAAIKLMSARDGLTPKAYKSFLDGTHLLDLEAGAKAYKKGNTLMSLAYSTKNADDFNLKYGVYKDPQPIDSYIDASITESAAK